MGKALDHEMALAHLCVPGLGLRVHTDIKTFHPTDSGDLHVLRFEHIIASLLAPQRRYASPAWHIV